jgi:DNA-binding response OmpR family regulator
LVGSRILVADDEFLIALDVAQTLTAAGAEVVGPCTTLTHALKVSETQVLTVALLDIRLGRDTTEAVADILHGRCIPFVFYSGQKLPESMRNRWPGARVISKPAEGRVLVNEIAGILQTKS